jgi:hypothetical protein
MFARPIYCTGELRVNDLLVSKIESEWPRPNFAIGTTDHDVKAGARVRIRNGSEPLIQVMEPKARMPFNSDYTGHIAESVRLLADRYRKRHYEGVPRFCVAFGQECSHA